MTFNTLEQRMAWAYIDIFPQFIPDEEAIVSVSEQERFYDLMKGLYQLAYNEPQLFVNQLHEDDAYPDRFNKSSYDKPDLQENMRKFLKTVDVLVHTMFVIAWKPDVGINRKQKAILNRLGISDFKKLPAAWIWMSTRPGASLSAFSHCFFKEGYPYTSDIYARLLGDEAAFRKLEDWMLSKGYKRHDIVDVTGGDSKLPLTYANPAWSKEVPRGGFEYKMIHTGISARYDPLIMCPPVFGLCIPKGMKVYLDAFDLMDEMLKEFVIERTKKCDGCRYCVQMDKTGTKEPAFVTVRHGDEDYRLCTYFPGFSYCWTRIDAELVEKLIKILEFMDGFVKNKKNAGNSSKSAEIK